METIIVSDLHLGSRFCLIEEVQRFLAELPAGATLVLNGDTVDYRAPRLPPAHAAALQRLREESLRRRVVWVRGNHDERFRMDDPARIEFCPAFRIGQRLFAAHGYIFDNIMPYHRLFIWTFRFFHRLRLALGAPPVHVAHYAKKFKRLYRVLCRHVALNAVEHCLENGIGAAACGHTHSVEDRVIRGVRYFNTGAWTEPPLVYLRVTDETMELRRFAP